MFGQVETVVFTERCGALHRDGWVAVDWFGFHRNILRIDKKRPKKFSG